MDDVAYSAWWSDKAAAPALKEGTGAFFYPHPALLSARMQALAGVQGGAVEALEKACSVRLLVMQEGESWAEWKGQGGQ